MFLQDYYVKRLKIFKLMVIMLPIFGLNNQVEELSSLTSQNLFIGYTIPAGWTILVAASAQQLNPSVFDDALEFNPSRWKVLF